LTGSVRAHRDQISDIAPWAIAAVPEIAISLAPEHVHLRHGSYSFHWQECAEAIEAVAALDRDAAAAIVDANRELLAKELGAVDDYSGQEFGQFARVLDSVDAGLLDGLLADLDIAAVAPHWLKRLDDAGEGATVVRALLERLGVTEENFITTYRHGDAVDS
jgi:hypothetical protein